MLFLGESHIGTSWNKHLFLGLLQKSWEIPVLFSSLAYCITGVCYFCHNHLVNWVSHRGTLQKAVLFQSWPEFILFQRQSDLTYKYIYFGKVLNYILRFVFSNEVNSTEFVWGVPPPSPQVLLFRNHTTAKHLEREMPLQQIYTWPEGGSLARKPERAEGFLRVWVTPVRTKSSPLWQGAFRYLCQL